MFTQITNVDDNKIQVPKIPLLVKKQKIMHSPTNDEKSKNYDDLLNYLENYD